MSTILAEQQKLTAMLGGVPMGRSAIVDAAVESLRRAYGLQDAAMPKVPGVLKMASTEAPTII